MVQHDIVRTVDKIVEVSSGYELVHEAELTNRLPHQNFNIVSIWNMPDPSSSSARPDAQLQPIARVISGKGGANLGVRVQIWSVSVQQQRYSYGVDGPAATPSYDEPVGNALRDAIAVARSRVYVRFVMDNVPPGVVLRVHLRCKVALDKRRTKWDHIRKCPKQLREDQLPPGETKIVSKF